MSCLVNDKELSLYDAGNEVIKNRSSKRKKFQNKSSNITFLKEKFQKFKIIK